MTVKGVKDGENGWIKATGRKWNPVEGEYIRGIYKRTEHQKNPNKPSEELKRYIIVADSDEITVYGTTVLDDLFKDIPVGHEVCIEFVGTKSNKPPLSPTKLFEVHHRPQVKDEVSGAAGDDLEPETEPEKEPESPTMNTADNVEVQAFVNGVEADLRDTGKNVLEVNVWALARKQAGDDKAFLDAVKKEIRSREYGN